MDLRQAFLLRYVPLQEFHIPFFYEKVPEDNLRLQPVNGVNPIVWCLWHVARTEDIGLNRMATDGKQVFDEGGWQEKLKLPFRHFGIGMTEDEVARLASTIDIRLLHQYAKQVGNRTVVIVENLVPSSLDAIVSDEYVTRVLKDEGAVKPENFKRSFEAYQGNAKGWFLMHMGMTHTYIHVGEMNTVASLMGIHRI